MTDVSRAQVFLSYSHHDALWLERLKVMLRPLDRSISLWDDTRIKSGGSWREEIEAALVSAKAAVLLVSPDFLASDFINEHELPPLLEAARKSGLKILWIAISSSLYRETEIAKYQPVNDPERPLDGLNSGELNRQLVQICQRIKDAVDPPIRNAKPRVDLPAAGIDSPHREPDLTPKSDRVTRDDRARAKQRSGPKAFRNPYDFASAAAKSMFKGRDHELAQFLSQVADGTHTSIFGLQRVGKTSLVEEALMDRVNDRPDLRDRVRFAKVDLQRFGSDYTTYRTLFQTTLKAVLEALPTAGKTVVKAKKIQDQVDMFTAILPSYSASSKMQIGADFARVLEKVASLSPWTIVLFFDEFSELCRVIERNETLATRNPSRRLTIHPSEMLIDVDFMQTFSSLLRSNIIKQKLMFVFAVRPFMAEYDKRRSLQLLKLTKPIMLYNLDERSAKALITERLRGTVEYQDEAVGYLCHITGGHPYLIQFILKDVIDRLKSEARNTVRLDDVRHFAQKMISEGPAYQAQFDVLDSDYSVDEVMDEGKRGALGKGVLSVIARLSTDENRGLVDTAIVIRELGGHGVSQEKVTAVLEQLVHAKILLEEEKGRQLYIRMAVPLLGSRYVKQNYYLKHFGR